MNNTPTDKIVWYSCYTCSESYDTNELIDGYICPVCGYLSPESELEKSYFSEVYDLLCNLGGASMNEKERFIDAHLSKGRDKYNMEICREWRFCGYFGFGGKYRRRRNAIDYYQESETPKLNKLLNKINHELKEIYHKYRSMGLEIEVDTL